MLFSILLRRARVRGIFVTHKTSRFEPGDSVGGKGKVVPILVGCESGKKIHIWFNIVRPSDTLVLEVSYLTFPM